MDESIKEQLDNLRVAQRFTQAPPYGLGFSATQIRNACESPTDTQLVRWDDLQVLIFARAFASHTDLVGIATSTDPWTTVFGFRVFPDLCETPLDELTPLQIVNLMADRFGLMMTIGDKSGRFFSEQEVDISTIARSGHASGKLVDVENPNERFYAATEAVEYRGNSVRIALAFTIDTMQYWQWASNR